MLSTKKKLDIYHKTGSKKKANNNIKLISIFLIFQIIFGLLTLPILIFYGPFENVKCKFVGASYHTLKHRYICEFFLSDQAISRILKNSSATDPFENSSEHIETINFSNNHTERIEVYDIEGRSLKGKMLVVLDPTRVKIGYSSKMPASGETTSTIAKNNNAIAAINAGGFIDTHWAGTGGAPMGFLIHNGNVIYNQLNDENKKQDSVAFTNTGMLIVGKHSIEELKKYSVKEGVSFGPPLVVNGKPTIKKGDGAWGVAPRTAIGQRADGAVLLLVIDGRSVKSLGATLRDVQEIFIQYHAVNAANLDGGSSTTMYYSGKIINSPSDFLGERAVPSVFLVSQSKGSD